MSGDGLTWGKAPGGTTRRGATRLALAGASAAHRAVIVGTILGAALLVFADRPWYASHAGALPGPGLSPLEDQQIAGLIMWIPAGMVYVIRHAGAGRYRGDAAGDSTAHRGRSVGAMRAAALTLAIMALIMLGYIAGALRNDRANLVRCIRDPQAIEPGTVMPKLGVTKLEVRDIASHLTALR